MSTAIVTSESKPALSDLATRINQEHVACEAAIQSALQHARACGDALIEAKHVIGHGQFEAWIKANCQFSSRMARSYMTLARGWDQILELTSKRKRASDLGIESLSVREALRILAPPEDAVEDGAQDANLIDMVCPSCGERLAATSRRYVTCPACWDCRLYPNPKLPSYERGSFLASELVARNFARIHDLRGRVDVVVDLLAKLDTETLAELTRVIETPRSPSQRSAAEHLEGLLSPVH